MKEKKIYYRCIENFIMDDGTTAFIRDVIYSGFQYELSDFTFNKSSVGMVTHTMPIDLLNEYFEEVIVKKAPKKKVIKFKVGMVDYFLTEGKLYQGTIGNGKFIFFTTHFELLIKKYNNLK